MTRFVFRAWHALPARAVFSLVLLVALAPRISAAAEPAVRPLPAHPGNIFLAGEDVVVTMPEDDEEAWKLIDYSGKLVKEGRSAQGRVALGQLGVGYYELRTGSGSASLGVLAPLAVPTPKTSPIGIDVAMSWFYGDERKAAVANLCALAGMNWVRDRLTWVEMEPKPGEFAGKNRYDTSARIQSEAGLQVLQVIHMTPQWATGEPKRFPPDLRHAHRFFREMARRWKGQVQAFEPWNEADIDVFGGHSGAEMASFQKASYLGLKAGNPDVIACLNVFAVNRKAQQQDLAANLTWPYFDTCNLHHYIPLAQYPDWYASFRAISAGRPLWVSEFAMPLKWTGDEKIQELSEADLRAQSERVPMVFAASLHEGSRAAFFFLFPHYVEGQTQFGIVRRDLTPRPAFLALAAAGRLLADAQPLGRLKSDPEGLHAYAFRARPDGVARDVVVAWNGSKEHDLRLTEAPTALFDHLGRVLPLEGGTVRIDGHPRYLILPEGAAARLPVDSAPSMPAREQAEPSSVVLQVLWPDTKKISLGESAYGVNPGEPLSLNLYAYNFGGQPASGTLKLEGPSDAKLSLPERVELDPNQRLEVSLRIEVPGAADGIQTVRISGDFGAAGRPVLSFRLQPQRPQPAAN